MLVKVGLPPLLHRQIDALAMCGLALPHPHRCKIIVIGDAICQNLNRIVRSLYLGFSGDVAFIDNQVTPTRYRPGWARATAWPICGRAAADRGLVAGVLERVHSDNLQVADALVFGAVGLLAVVHISGCLEVA